MTHCYGESRGTEMLVWDVHKLWEKAAALPVHELRLTDLEPVLAQRRCRFWPDGYSAPSYLDLAACAGRVKEADLSYPIILSAEGAVMDGMNRLTKAWVLGHETVRAVRFPVTPEPDERRPLGQSPTPSR